MPRSQCDFCCAPEELARNRDTFRAAALQIGCAELDTLLIANEILNDILIQLEAGGTSGVQYPEGSVVPVATGNVFLWKDVGNVLTSVSATKPLPVTIISGVSGVQYTDGDVDATVTGTAVMWKSAGNVLESVSAAFPLPVVDAALTLAQNSVTAGQLGPLIQGAVTTADPVYVTGRTDPLSLGTDGSLRVSSKTKDGVGNNIVSYTIDSNADRALTTFAQCGYAFGGMSGIPQVGSTASVIQTLPGNGASPGDIYFVNNSVTARNGSFRTITSATSTSITLDFPLVPGTGLTGDNFQLWHPRFLAVDVASNAMLIQSAGALTVTLDNANGAAVYSRQDNTEGDITADGEEVNTGASSIGSNAITAFITGTITSGDIVAQAQDRDGVWYNIPMWDSTGHTFATLTSLPASNIFYINGQGGQAIRLIGENGFSGAIHAVMTWDGIGDYDHVYVSKADPDITQSRNDTYTAAASGTIIDFGPEKARKSFTLQVVATGAVSVWDVRLEGSLDGTTFGQILQHTNTDLSGTLKFSVLAPVRYVRTRCAAITLGAGTNVKAYFVSD